MHTDCDWYSRSLLSIVGAATPLIVVVTSAASSSPSSSSMVGLMADVSLVRHPIHYLALYIRGGITNCRGS